MTVGTSNQTQSNVNATRNQSGRFQPPDEQSQRARKLALQRAGAHRLKRLEVLYAQYLNNQPDSIIATQITNGDFFMSTKQGQTYFKLQNNLKKARPLDVTIGNNYINTGISVIFFFKHINTCIFRTDFKVVVETPLRMFPTLTSLSRCTSSNITRFLK
jgi:hypothetical protein